jgi:hypothetical protein
MVAEGRAERRDGDDQRQLGFAGGGEDARGDHQAFAGDHWKEPVDRRDREEQEVHPG